MLMAGDVKINKDLSNALGGIGDQQQKSVSDIYAKKRSQLMADARPNAGVLAPGSYASDRLNTGEGQSMANLRGSLESVLGNTAYADKKSEREYQQNYELAKRIGDLMSPSVYEQVLSGLGGGAQAGGQFYGLYNALNRPQVASAPRTNYSDLGYRPEWIG